VVISLLSASGAWAQQAPSNALTAPPSAAETSVPKDEAEEEFAPMSWAGIGVKLGVMGISTAKLDISGTSSRIDSRAGLFASVPIWMGADGIGWLIEPYYFGSSVTREIIDDETEVVVSKEEVKLNTLGCGGGPTIIIQTRKRELFVGTGLHARWGWSLNDGYKYAFDLYGRVPLNVTYYVHKQVAVTFEGGFGYGGSAFANKPETRTLTPEEIQAIRDSGKMPSANDVLQVDTEFKFGLATTWDINVGVRFP
jgi:hypothetical protein